MSYAASEELVKGGMVSLTRNNNHRRSTVGPGALKRCQANKIAQVQCEVLQPQPSAFPQSLTSKSRPDTLLPSNTRTLWLWKNVEDYHLTVIKEDKDDVFLDLPLSKVLTGTLSYDINKQWHEVAVFRENSEHPPRRFVFLLKSSVPDHTDVKDFNQKLEVVFSDIYAASGIGSEEKYPGNVAVLQNGAAPDERGGLTRTVGAVVPIAMTEVTSAVVSEMASRQPQKKPQVSLPPETVEQMALALAVAIQTGNVIKAQNLASVLAQAHTNVEVTYNTAAEELRAREQEISVTVHVEDRESSGLILTDKVRPSDTVLDIKRMFLGKYGFPLEVQKWIIGKRIPGDEETLKQCNVSVSGHTLYLYLLNARAVNLDRNDERGGQRQQGAGTTGGSPGPRPNRADADYQTMNFPLAPNASAPAIGPPGHGPNSTMDTNPLSTGGATATRQQSQLSNSAATTTSSSNNSSNTSLATLSFSPPDIRGSLEPGPISGQRGGDVGRGGGGGLAEGGQLMGQSVMTGGGAAATGADMRRGLLGSLPPLEGMESESESEQGWQCPHCTLINQPTRPGCEVCGNDRPADYRVPSNVIISEEERLRLEREQQLEAFLRETSRGQQWPQDWGQGEGTTTTNPPPYPPSLHLAPKEKLTEDQLDLILRFNDAIQEHLTPAAAALEDSSVDHQDMVRRGRNSQLAPSGVRQPVQDPAEFGEDVIDGAHGRGALLGWAAEED